VLAGQKKVVFVPYAPVLAFKKLPTGERFPGESVQVLVEVRNMLEARIPAILAAASAAMMVAGAAFAAPPEDERSYLPPQISQPHDAKGSEKAAPPASSNRAPKARARTRRGYRFGPDYEGPPHMLFPPGLFFPF